MDKMRIFLKYCFYQVLVVFIASSTALGGEIELAWNPVQEPVSGYKLHYGLSHGTYTESLDVGKVTTYTLTGLEDGETYYIVATAYNGAGEGGYSDEVFSLAAPDDEESPTATITQPTSGDTYSTDQDRISLNGTASDNIGVTSVTWTNNRGGSGTASVDTNNWTISNISLQEGDNVITVTAHDAAGNTGSDALTVTYTSSALPDTTPPTATITNPTSSPTYSTESHSISLSGSASDDIGVTSVTWTNSRGGSGTASGTTNWTITGISLQEGDNVIIVTAHDAAGNAGTDMLTVTYTPPSGTYTKVFGDVTGSDEPGTLEDTFINVNEENSSSHEYLNTYTWPQDKVANAIIMKWDLSAIPSSATIQDAKLYLHLSDISGEGGDDLYDLTMHKIINYNPVISACTGYTCDGSNSWTPNSQCHDNIPMAQADIASAEETKSIDKTYGYKSWSVTNMVQDWVSSSASNYGMLVNSDAVASSDTNRVFSSTECSNPDQRPKLVVTYSVGNEPDTTDPTITITQPTSADTYSISQSNINLGGTASDNVGVTSVTWTNNRGGTGTASGANNWTISNIIILQEGDNVITVTAHDAAGNTATDTLTVTYTPLDTIDPTVTITSPTSGSTYSTSQSTLGLGGTTSDNIGVTSVTWTNDRGGDGTALGTINWTMSNISLQEGNNVITVTALDAAGNTGTDTLIVSYGPPDTTAPTVTITSPTSGDAYSTEGDSINIGGAASDNIGVTSVTWTNNRGGSGTASGVDSWTISNISLQEGNNVITVAAHDDAGNTGSDTLTVTYSPPTGTYTKEFGSATGSDYPGTLEDTFINISEENSSTHQYLNTFTWPQDKVANAIIMKWDLSAIPSSATIQDATLYLYLSDMYDEGKDDVYDLTVHKIVNYNPVISACTGYTYDGTNSWTPNSQCYDNIPLAQADIAAAEDTKSIDKTYGYKSWSVTNMVQDWVFSSGSNYGMLVNSDPVASSDSNRFFSSTECANLDQRPKLVVTYTVGEEPDTTDPTVTITQPTSEDTYHTKENSVTLGGSASDNVGVTSVTWENDQGGSGTASGTSNWTISGIPLHCGEDNIIKITSEDAAGNTGTDTITIDVKPCPVTGMH